MSSMRSAHLEAWTGDRALTTEAVIFQAAAPVANHARRLL